MVMRGSIPFGTMYCTLTQSYCTELGHALDDEQFALDFVKAIKKKDDSIRTTKEKKILKEVKKLEKKTSRSGHKHMGKYTCKAENKAGAISHSASLKVNGNFYFPRKGRKMSGRRRLTIGSSQASDSF